MSHTPGPWLVADVNAPVNINVVAAIGVEWCVHADAEFGDTEADARLISAAPDLLAACEMVPPLLKEMQGLASDLFGGESSLTDCLDLVMAETQAAIAKAKGEVQP